MAITVNADNFVRAETDRLLADFQRDAGGVNRWRHNRVPTPIDHQLVIRMNRDTLYSSVVVDLAAPARITIPDAGRRYQSLMVVNQDHYLNRIFHGSGEHVLTQAEFETRYVLAGVRVLVDPANPADVEAVNAIQDGFGLHAGSAEPFVSPEYDRASLDATREPLLSLARGFQGFDHAFGPKAEVDPIRHLIGTAAGWGGLPEREATYINVDPGLPVGEYQLTVRDVPVDGFWSISIYNRAGYFEPNDRNAYSVNNLTATRNADGSVTVNFGGCTDDRPNCLPISDGWNYLIRLYRPRQEIFDGSLQFPAAKPAK